MGIFDKLKKLKNYISGTGAELHVVIDNSDVRIGGILRVKVLCHVKEHDVLVDKLYVHLKAEEMVSYRYTPNNHNVNNRGRHASGTKKTAYAITYKEELIIDENFRLDAEGEYEWDSELMIPSNIAGTYHGINARHEWKVLAGLSKKGNDPDSGWVVFEV